MVYLKIIFYGLLAFIERHPIFTFLIVILAFCAPMVLKTIGWIILGVLAVALILIALAVFRFRKMQRQMEDQFRSGAGAGFGGAQGFSGAGFSGFNAQGMSLEELVRQMQEQANARQRAQSGAGADTTTTTTSSQQSQQKRVNDKVGDYVDFEEVE